MLCATCNINIHSSSIVASGDHDTLLHWVFLHVAGLGEREERKCVCCVSDWVSSAFTYPSQNLVCDLSANELIFFILYAVFRFLSIFTLVLVVFTIRTVFKRWKSAATDEIVNEV